MGRRRGLRLNLYLDGSVDMVAYGRLAALLLAGSGPSSIEDLQVSMMLDLKLERMDVRLKTRSVNMQCGWGGITSGGVELCNGNGGIS